jgi:hypothetical protein
MLRKTAMRFGTWKVRSLYRAGLLMTVAKEISKYKLDLVRVQEVRWRGIAPNLQENIQFSVERGVIIMN